MDYAVTTKATKHHRKQNQIKMRLLQRQALYEAGLQLISFNEWTLGIVSMTGKVCSVGLLTQAFKPKQQCRSIFDSSYLGLVEQSMQRCEA